MATRPPRPALALLLWLWLLQGCASSLEPALQEEADAGQRDDQGEATPEDLGLDQGLEGEDAAPGEDLPPEAELDAWDQGADLPMDAWEDLADAAPDLPGEQDMTQEADLDLGGETPPVPGCARIRVQGTGGIGLNLRADPSTAQPPLGSIPEGGVAEVLDRVQGQEIEGDPAWYQVRYQNIEGFVSAVWALCEDIPAPGPSDDVFLLPFPCGQSYTVSQGNHSQFSHNGRAAWAFDFSMGSGTPMLAMKPGVVSHLYAGTRPGDACYDGGGRECINAANYVGLRHADGTRTHYLHLSRVDVSLGQVLAQGEPLGASGSTGWSTGPHAHVERQEDCATAFCQSLPMEFGDVSGGVPTQGQSVTSGNGCP